MRGIIIFIGLSFVLLSFIGCVHHTHDIEKHDFIGHFGDIDTDGDESVNWEEFKKYFPHSEKKAFIRVDSNSDGLIDHDEWHKFKEKHGYGHKEI
jgi:hypothetical protein